MELITKLINYFIPEDERIKRTIEKKKKQAKEMGLHKLICNLYADSIQHFPVWINNNREYVPMLVSKCSTTHEGKNEDILLEMKGKQYHIFFRSREFTTPDGDYHRHGNIDIIFLGTKYFSVSVAKEMNEYNTEWNPIDIEAFREGEWIHDFKLLQNCIKQNDEIRKIKATKDKINKDKNNFGIN